MRLKFLSVGITFLFAFGVMAVSSYAKIDPKNCIGIWLFDEGSGDVAKDSSENKNDGKIVNGPKWVEGRFGKALSFDGVDDYVNLPTIVSTNWQGMTLMAWVWLELLPNELPYSYDEILGSKQDLYDMYEDKGNNELRVKFTSTAGAERPGIPTAQLQKNQWLHIAGVFDGQAGKAMIYMNGKLIDTHNLSGNINGTQYSSIGAQGGPDGPFTDYHKGLIDEVALLNVALSEDEIQNVISKGLKQVLGIAAVVHSEKLATTWANIKAR